MPTVEQWGDSLVLRIPEALLARAGLGLGDAVDFSVNARGHLEIAPVERHRHGTPTPGITFETLFADYDGGPQRLREEEGRAFSPWTDDGFYGAELEAWSN